MKRSLTARLILIAVLLATVATLAVSGAPATAQSGNTWRLDSFNNPNWSGAPVDTQFASFASFDWGYGSPSPWVPVDNFSVRFTTDAFFYAGSYNFSVVADDEFVMLVNGQPVFDTRGRALSGKPQNFSLWMNQGTQRVEVLYREFTLAAYIFVNWWPAGQGQPPPPPVQNVPPLPASQDTITTPFGNYTPCRQQGIHQSNCFVSDGQWNSPNLGSIQMEPQIQSWVNCSPADEQRNFFVDPQNPSRRFKCSKTLAGWFPAD